MCRTILVAILPLFCACLVAHAQQVADEEVGARASALSAEGRFEAVVELLNPYLENHPDDTAAWLLLAQNAYWSGQTDYSEQTFEEALRMHGNHTGLRVAYARFLMESGRLAQAETVLEPLGRNSAEAETVRGTMAWWQGDLTSAANHFRHALRLDPDQQEAESGLSTIGLAMRPWIHVSGVADTDTQPLSSIRLSAEGGAFLTPLQAIRVELEQARFDMSDSIESSTFLSAGYRSYWPLANLETDLTVGIVSRLGSTDWTGEISAGFRLPHDLHLASLLRRAPYLYTVSSISENVMTTTVEFEVSADRDGWLGEAAVMHESYPDENARNGVFGWLLAPLIKDDFLMLQAGYTFSYENAQENRFVPFLSVAPIRGQKPVWEGRYLPYYTPLKRRSHSVSASVTVRFSQATTFRANGSYGFYGLEDAPFISQMGSVPVTGTYEQRIHPWNIRASVTTEIGSSLTVQMAGTHMAKTWYDASALTFSLYSRF